MTADDADVLMIDNCKTAFIAYPRHPRFSKFPFHTHELI